MMAKIRRRSWTTGSGEKRSAWAVDFVDAQGDRQRRQFATKREADDFRVQAEGQVRAGTFRSGADRTTIQEAAEAYLKHCQGRQERQEKMTRHHLETVEGIVKNHILSAETGVGGIKLSQLTASKVRAFRDRLRDADVSVPMTRKIIALSHACWATLSPRT